MCSKEDEFSVSSLKDNKHKLSSVQPMSDCFLHKSAYRRGKQFKRGIPNRVLLHFPIAHSSFVRFLIGSDKANKNRTHNKIFSNKVTLLCSSRLLAHSADRRVTSHSCWEISRKQAFKCTWGGSKGKAVRQQPASSHNHSAFIWGG